MPPPTRTGRLRASPRNSRGSKYPSSEDLAKHLKALTKALDRFFMDISGA
jgi:hypothetical protein